jgi:DNA-binding NtrC family response regulator
MKTAKEIRMIDLPESGCNIPVLFRMIEKDLIAQALIRTKSQNTFAAKLLGLKRTTLIEKMKRHGFMIRKPSRKRARAIA